MLGALGMMMLVGIALAAVISYVRPPFAFVMVLALYPLKQLQMTYMGLFAQNSSYFNFLIFGCVLAGVFGNMMRNRDTWGGYFNRPFVVLVVLYVYVLMGVLYSPVPENAMARVRDGAPYWAMQVLLLPLLFTTLDDVRKTFAPSLIVGLIACVLFFTNPNASFYAGRLTLNIPMAGVEYRGNPLATAQLGGHIAIIAALMMPVRAGWLMVLVRSAAIFLGLGMAVAAGSRGQLALALLAIVVFYPMARRVKSLQQFFGTVMGVAVFGLVALFALKIFLSQDAEQAGRWDLSEWGNQAGERSADAMRLFTAWYESPLHWPLGLGTNYFSFLRGEPMSYAHNVLIEIISENGIVGFCIYSTVVWLMVKDARELWGYYRDEPVGRATLACLLAQALFLTLLSYKQGTFVGLPEPYYIWVMLTKLVVQERRRVLAWQEEMAWAAYAAGAQSPAGVPVRG